MNPDNYCTLEMARRLQEAAGRRKTRLKMSLSNLMEFEKEDFTAWLLEPEHFCWLAAEWKMREG